MGCDCTSFYQEVFKTWCIVGICNSLSPFMYSINPVVNCVTTKHPEQWTIAKSRFKKVFSMTILFSCEVILANLSMAVSFWEAFLQIVWTYISKVNFESMKFLPPDYLKMYWNCINCISLCMWMGVGYTDPVSLLMIPITYLWCCYFFNNTSWFNCI